MPPPPLVAIVGAPNVGKSALFNRLVGRRKAIVTDEPGVTRDRLYGVVRHGRRRFRLVDTGGLTPGSQAHLAREIREQVTRALDEASAVLFVVDARAGITSLDREVASLLRRRSIPLVLVANKMDARSVEERALELYDLGLSDPIPVSAEHGLGIEDLLEALDERLGPKLVADEPGEEDRETPAVRVAIVGRPNVGKSSIVNRLIGEERVLVSDVPGTTRDAVDTRLEKDGRAYLLVDTAGLRRKGKVHLVAEALSVVRARQSIERADVAILILDGAGGFAAQDAHVAGYVLEALKPLLVAVNKWDLVEGREEAAKAWEQELRQRLRFAKEVPVLFVSARTGQRVARLLDLVDSLHRAAGVRVPTPALNRWLREAAAGERASQAGGRSVRLLYAAQTGVHPPSFVFFCSDAKGVHFSLRRRLENGLRERFGFDGAPIRLRFRSRRERAGR